MSNRKIVQKITAKKFPRAHGTNHSPIVFIGAGHLGGSIINSLVSKKLCTKKSLLIITKTQKSSKKWSSKGFCSENKIDLNQLKSAKEIWIAVKPHQFLEISDFLANNIHKHTLIYSLMAGWTPSSISRVLKNNNVICVMANTLAQIGQGTFVGFSTKQCPKKFKSLARFKLEKLGCFAGFYPEKKMPELTALIGSFPAFYFYFLNEYLEFSNSVNLSSRDSKTWFEVISKGCLEMMLNEKNIQKLIDQICTPGGCTEQGIMKLQKSRALSHALNACTQKARKLVK